MEFANNVWTNDEDEDKDGVKYRDVGQLVQSGNMDRLVRRQSMGTNTHIKDSSRKEGRGMTKIGKN